MAIEIRPADDFEAVRTMIGPKKPTSNVCWCLSYRVPSTLNKELSGTARADFVRELTEQQPPPGILAFEDDEVVGWAAVAPKADTTFVKNRKIPSVDDEGIWSLWCVRVRPGHRGKGIAHHLVVGAVDHARHSGAPALEGYPVDNGQERVDLTMAYTGLRSVFQKAGFVKVADTTSVLNGFPRILMRHDLTT